MLGPHDCGGRVQNVPSEAKVAPIRSHSDPRLTSSCLLCVGCSCVSS